MHPKACLLFLIISVSLIKDITSSHKPLSYLETYIITSSSAAFTAGAIDSKSCPPDASWCSPFVPRHLWFVLARLCVFLYVHPEFWSSGGAHDVVKLLSYHSSAMRLLDLSLNTVYGLQVWGVLFFIRIFENLNAVWRIEASIKARCIWYQNMLFVDTDL